MATQRLITILVLFVLAGCVEQSPQVPQTLPAATAQAEAVDPSPEQTPPPEIATERIGQADEFSGKVIHILDGDTIDILTNDKTTIRIRLNGIDAPETGQPFGKNAKQYLSETIGGQVVRVVPHGVDRYGRTIGEIYLKDKPGPFLQDAVLPDWNINREIVQAGLAWHYKKDSDDENLAMDESRAKERNVGLWSDARYVAPWDWRKLSKADRDKLQ